MRGDPADALARAEREREAARHHRAPKLEARAFSLRVQALAALERREEALAAAGELLAVAERIGYARARWQGLAFAAELERRAGRERAGPSPGGGARAGCTGARALAARRRAATRSARLRGSLAALTCPDGGGSAATRGLRSPASPRGSTSIWSRTRWRRRWPRGVRPARASLDLTSANPTRAGLRYPEAEILAALASPAALDYQPDPRGLPGARAAISAYYASRGESVDPEDLLLTASSSESYALLFKLLADPGDEILIPAPSYPLFDVLAALESVRLVRYPLVHSPEAGWRIQREALEAALSPRTRAIAVVHPNNPTGSYLRRDEKGWLEALCASRGLPLIADEVFLDYGRDAAGQTSFATAQGALAFALSGLSKLVGLPQLKLGWIALAGPAQARRRARERLEFIADAYLSVGAPVQHAAPALLGLRSAVQREIRQRVEANEARLRELCAAAAGVRPLEREGGWYAVIELSEAVDEEAFCIRLLEQHGVLVHPGYFFDFERQGVLVVSLLAEPEAFEEGIARLIESADSM